VTGFIEVGPGTVLCGLGRKAARDARFASFQVPEDLSSVEELFA
jgi:hypothetical protein